MVIDSSIDPHFNVISGESVQPIQVYDVCFHVDDVNRICEGVEVLKPRTHGLDVAPESLVNTFVSGRIPTKLWSICL